jgi:hypothetical protein
MISGGLFACVVGITWCAYQAGRDVGRDEGRAEAEAEARARALEALRHATGAGDVAEVAGRAFPLDPRSVSAGAWRVARGFLAQGVKEID